MENYTRNAMAELLLLAPYPEPIRTELRNELHGYTDYVHATQVLPLSVFVGLVVMLILAFYRPFLGDLGVDASPYEVVREQLMNP